MRRAELWTVAGGVDATKPRPALILKDDLLEGTDSVTVAPLTSHLTEAPLLRQRVTATDLSGRSIRMGRQAGAAMCADRWRDVLNHSSPPCPADNAGHEIRNGTPTEDRAMLMSLFERSPGPSFFCPRCQTAPRALAPGTPCVPRTALQPECSRL